MDSDGDGYGNTDEELGASGNTQGGLTPAYECPDGYVENDVDCDDANAEVYDTRLCIYNPDAAEGEECMSTRLCVASCPEIPDGMCEDIICVETDDAKEYMQQ